MKDVDVIVLNSHGVGQICHVKRLPRRGETMEATNWRVEEDGGKGATVSVALGRLGIKTAYIGKVGFDPWGDMGEKWMSESGVDTEFMYRDKNVATGTGLIMVDEDGLNTIVDGQSATEALREEEMDRAIDALSKAGYFITGFGMPYRKALYGAKRAKEKYGMTTFCNVSPVPSEGFGEVEFIDFLIYNDIEARVDLNLDEKDGSDLLSMAKQLSDKHKVKGIIITCGGDGSFIFDGGKSWFVEALKVEVKDTIGAGDGYLAALVGALVKGKDLVEASKWASYYASYKVTRRGTMTRKEGQGYPQLKDFQDFLTKIDK